MKRVRYIAGTGVLIWFLAVGMASAERNLGVAGAIPHEGKPVAGRVVDSDENPVSGAEISVPLLRMPDGNVQRDPEGMRTKTGADGRFIIHGLSRGSAVDLIVRAKGYTVAFLNQVRTGNTNLVFRLLPEGIVEGKVTFGDTGEPAKGTTVSLVGRNPYLPENILTAMTDSRGVYRIGNVPPGMVTVAAVPGKLDMDWAPSASAMIEIFQGKTASGIDIHLSRGGEVTGRVTDRDTGKPIAGVRIGATSRGSGFVHTRLEAITDSQGTYRLRGGAGKMYISLQNPKGYSFTPSFREIAVGDGNTVSGIDFSFSRGGTLKGRAVFPDGAPAAGVSIRPDFDARELAWFTATDSDSTGAFTLRNVEAGFPIILIAEHKTLHLACQATFRPDEDILVRLKSYETADIGGRVIDEERNPVADAEISLGFTIPVTNARGESVKAFTDSLGEYRFTGVPGRGRFTLGVEAGGYKTRHVSFDSTGAGVRRLPDAIILRTDRFITGTVVDVNGNPVEGAVVRVNTGCCDEHVEVRTDARGRFRLDGLIHLVEPEVLVSRTILGYARYAWVTTNERHDFTLPKAKGKNAIKDWEVCRKEGILMEGKPAPALDVSRWLTGGPLTLGDLRGKIVVLDFWSERNGEDEQSYRLMETLHRLYGRDGVVVIGIHEYTGDIETVRRACAARGISYPVAVDTQSPSPDSRGRTFDAFRFTDFPHHVIIDTEGLVNMPNIATDGHIPTGPAFAGGPADQLDIDSKVRRMRKAPAR